MPALTLIFTHCHPSKFNSGNLRFGKKTDFCKANTYKRYVSFSKLNTGYLVRKHALKIVHTAINHDYMLANYSDLIVNRTLKQREKKLHNYMLVNCFDLIENRTLKQRKKNHKK